MALEFSERIARIPVYPAAGGYAQRAPKVRLASNESPWPPLPAVIDAIQGVLPTLNRYPDPTNSLLRERLSERYGVPVSRIAIGNGSCDILLAVGEALLGARRRVRVCVAVLLCLPSPERRFRRARAHRSTRRKRLPRPRRDAARDHGRYTPCHRVQPKQPYEHRVAAR